MTARLEDELRTELQNASEMGTTNLQEAVASEISGGGCPLAMVEDVEGFGPEFEGHVLLYGKVLEQCHIEIGSVGIAQVVSARVPKREPRWDGKSSGIIEEPGIAAQRDLARWWDVSSGIADDVRVGAGPNAIADSGVVADVGTIRHRERRAC